MLGHNGPTTATKDLIQLHFTSYSQIEDNSEQSHCDPRQQILGQIHRESLG
jgi:hypothetical protein